MKLIVIDSLIKNNKLCHGHVAIALYFVSRLLISTNWKGNTYNSILIIIYGLKTMINYK